MGKLSVAPNYSLGKISYLIALYNYPALVLSMTLFIVFFDSFFSLLEWEAENNTRTIIITYTIMGESIYVYSKISYKRK